VGGALGTVTTLVQTKIGPLTGPLTRHLYKRNRYSCSHQSSSCGLKSGFLRRRLVSSVLMHAVCIVVASSLLHPEYSKSAERRKHGRGNDLSGTLVRRDLDKRRGV